MAEVRWRSWAWGQVWGRIVKTGASGDRKQTPGNLGSNTSPFPARPGHRKTIPPSTQPIRSDRIGWAPLCATASKVRRVPGISEERVAVRRVRHEVAEGGDDDAVRPAA